MWKAKEISEDENLIKEVEVGNIRKCAYCGMYSPVEKFLSEYKYKGRDIYDICDNCVHILNKGEYINVLEDCSYEDCLEEI